MLHTSTAFLSPLTSSGPSGWLSWSAESFGSSAVLNPGVETFRVISLPLTVTPTPTPTATATATTTEPAPAPTVTVTTTAEPSGPSTVVLDGEQFTGLTVGIVLVVTFLVAIFVSQMRRP